MKAEEQFPHVVRLAELRKRIAEGSISKLQQRRQLVLIELVYALPHVLSEYGKAANDVRQHAEQVAVLSLDDLLRTYSAPVVPAATAQLPAAISQRLIWRPPPHSRSCRKCSCPVSKVVSRAGLDGDPP